jgi:molybdate transport repressor ModE-like protein
MLKIHIRQHWEISFEAGPPLDTAALLGLLLAIQDTGSIAQAAKSVGLSYRYAWGLLREAGGLFGEALLHTGRGRGTDLSALAEKLVWADRRIGARLMPTLESLATELATELESFASEPLQAIRMDASHGFAVAALAARMKELGMPLALRYRRATEAVAALARGECDVAGFHVPCGTHEAQTAAWYRRYLEPDQHCLVHIATREQGLFVAPGNPLAVRSLADLARPALRFVNRQAGSGTRMLCEMLLAQEGIDADAVNGFNNTEFTHSAVAACIASGMADVGLGVRTAAARFGLDFIPLLRERYFFALHRAAVDTPLMQQLLGILRQGSYHCTVAALAGYDAADTGKLASFAETFPVR